MNEKQREKREERREEVNGENELTQRKYLSNTIMIKKNTYSSFLKERSVGAIRNERKEEEHERLVRCGFAFIDDLFYSLIKETM